MASYIPFILTIEAILRLHYFRIKMATLFVNKNNREIWNEKNLWSAIKVIINSFLDLYFKTLQYKNKSIWSIMYEDGIVHDILCDKLSGRHYHLELHCVPCNMKVLYNDINFSFYIRIIVVKNPILIICFWISHH